MALSSAPGHYCFPHKRNKAARRFEQPVLRFHPIQNKLKKLYMIIFLMRFHKYDILLITNFRDSMSARPLHLLNMSSEIVKQ